MSSVWFVVGLLEQRADPPELFTDHVSGIGFCSLFTLLILEQDREQVQEWIKFIDNFLSLTINKKWLRFILENKVTLHKCIFLFKTVITTFFLLQSSFSLAEQCGVQVGGTICPEGLCCNAYGYCGSSDGYCCINLGNSGSGCQINAGDCYICGPSVIFSTPLQAIKTMVTPRTSINCSNANTDAFTLKGQQALPQSKIINAL